MRQAYFGHSVQIHNHNFTNSLNNQDSPTKERQSRLRSTYSARNGAPRRGAFSKSICAMEKNSQASTAQSLKTTWHISCLSYSPPCFNQPTLPHPTTFNYCISSIRWCLKQSPPLNSGGTIRSSKQNKRHPQTVAAATIHGAQTSMY